jgi:AcrR family transcriptional regulator
MEPTATSARKSGLRELKKQRTRQTILDRALSLFAEHGYAHTTLEDIAEAAEVSTGTLFAYFPSKEEILFPEEGPFYEQLKQRLERRTGDATTFDVLRDLLPTLEPPDETFRLRMKILNDEGMRDRHRPRLTRVERLLAESIAKDLGEAPDDLRPTLLAASTSAVLAKVAERLQPESGKAASHADVLSVLEQMFNVLRSGLDKPQRPGSSPRR